ncbi:substrate-binding periplasmic protein [Shimia haliotis]|uniref:Amino acid ABC transporter substrate-binding protein, PAAT family n=1 Tax=Shimia haliotis TaxID=1280847 RepID=A0A1I4GHY7_9RHOB|nr:transporter substrate-binding domain-containing protein [Shimia haliotis]SFL28736.1 amino acid ABC transporter substrate-binding protein, PAAT family [Shimia haliotis]
MKKTAVLFALLAPTAALAQEASLNLFTEINRPYSYMEGERLSGHAVDFMKEALARSGVMASMELTKWSRAITLAEQQDNTCVFTTARTEEREEKFQWVGPMYTSSEYLLQRVGSNTDVSSLEEALTKTIGTQAGDYTVQKLKKQGATNIDLAADQSMTLKKLKAGRLDYAIVWGNAAAAATESGELEVAMEASQTSVYLACSKTTDAVLIEKLDRAIHSIVDDGTRDAFMSKYDQ